MSDVKRKQCGRGKIVPGRNGISEGMEAGKTGMFQRIDVFLLEIVVTWMSKSFSNLKKLIV